MAEEKKPKKLTAVALEYNPGEVAPKVVASGFGKTAERIIEKAKEAGVPTHTLQP